MNPFDLLLYDSPGSPCARRVKITMAEKKLTWDSQVIDLSRMQQRSPRYLAINPNGLVPALAHGNRVLWESNVITEYLDRVFPDVPLYPRDAAERLAVKRWQAAELAMAKTFRPLMYQRLMGPVIHASRTHAQAMEIARASTDDPADLAWEDRVWRLAVLDAAQQAEAERTLYAFADAVENALRRHGWLVGDGFTQAEISIYPRLTMFPMLGLSLDGPAYEHTRAWLGKLEGRPSFVETESAQERGLRMFASTAAFRLVRRVTARPAPKRGLFDRLALAVIGSQIRRALRPGPRAAGWLAPPNAAPAVGVVGPRPRASLAPRDDFSLMAPGGSSDAAVFETALRWRRMGPVPRASGPFAVNFAGETYADIPAAFDLVDVLDVDGPRLFPDEVWADTQIRQWLAFDASLHKEVKALEAAARGETAPAGVLPVEPAKAILGARFDQLDAHLATRSWLVGDGMSIADRALATRVQALAGLGAPIGPDRRRLRDWVERSLSPSMAPEPREGS